MIENNYFVNQNMMYMAGFYDRKTRACTLVKETERLFVVEKSPVELLEFSMMEVEFPFMDDKSASAAQNLQLLTADSILNLVVFPAESANQVDTIWLNPEQIHRTRRSKYFHNKTAIIFKNGDILTIVSKLSADSKKLQTAKQYRNMRIRAVQKSFSIILDPKNKLFLILIFAYQLLTGDFGYDFSC